MYNYKNYQWNITNQGYVRAWINGKHVKLHRFILNASKDYEVDHKFGNKLDNRKSELRICTKSENLMNQEVHSNNKSGYKGVSFKRKLNKWTAQIQKYGKRTHLGYFNTKEEAAKSYNEAANKYYKEYARLNKISI